MTSTRRGSRRSPQQPADGLPMWCHVIVFLTLAALFAWNIVRYGPDGLGNSYVIGGLLGVYSGTNQLVQWRRRGRGDDQDQAPPTPPEDG